MSRPPETLETRLDTIPPALKPLDHWVRWKWYLTRDKKWSKLPVNAVTGEAASSTDPLTWCIFDQAVDIHSPKIGFVFQQPEDPDERARLLWVCGVDLDGCRDPETGVIAEWAWKIIRAFNSYTELSPTGTGVKIFLLGGLPDRLPDGHVFWNKHNLTEIEGSGGKAPAIEMYWNERFYVVTGHHLEGTPPDLVDRAEVFLALQMEHARKLQKAAVHKVAGEPLSLDDETILRKAMTASNWPKIQRLLNGDASDYGGDDSRVDAALVGCFSFYTEDAGQLENIIRSTAVGRPKWDEPRPGGTYLSYTINNILALPRSERYTPGRNGSSPQRSRHEEVEAGGEGESALENLLAAAKETGDPKVVYDQIEVLAELPAAELGKAKAELRKALGKALNMTDLTRALGEARRQSDKVPQATRLVELALSDGVELLHDGEVAYVSFRAGDHRETHPLKTAGFRRHLINLYFLTEEGRAPGSQALQEALDTLEARAFRFGEKQRVFIRLAEHAGTIYLDLTNDAWEAVAISPDGWEIVRNPPVKFRRKAGMLPLPRPERGGSLAALWNFANIQEGPDRVLFVAALVAALRPTGPYPVLGLHGEQGTAKSTTARIFRGLADPNQAALRDAPDEARDLMVAATNSWMVAFDNLSGLPLWLSDSLCRLATGAGFGIRKNYTDDEEMLFVACRPVLLTGIGEAASRPDLLDRSILLTLPVITEDNRRDEKTFWAEFETAHPSILGALLDGVAAALKNLPETKLDRLPRMADFALWATAAEPGLGWEKGTFLKAYQGNRDAANSIALEASAIGDLVRDLVREKGEVGWTGKASDLLTLLTNRASETATKRKDWPKSARSLSVALKAIAPNLRAEKVEVVFNSPSGGRKISLSQIPDFTSEHKESAKESANDGFADSGSTFADSESGLRTPSTHKSPQTRDLNAKFPICSEMAEKIEEEREREKIGPTRNNRDFADSANFADSAPVKVLDL
jgi:primase-polymerase (primpol)-like protein